MSILTALVSYIFDAYPPRGTLSALTLMACVRIICAGWLPLVIIQMIMNVTGRWTFSIFGFIAAGLVVVPFILYRFGPSLRARSRHSGSMMAGGNRKMEHQIDEEMRTGVGSRHSP